MNYYYNFYLNNHYDTDLEQQVIVERIKNSLQIESQIKEINGKLEYFIDKQSKNKSRFKCQRFLDSFVDLLDNLTNRGEFQVLFQKLNKIIGVILNIFLEQIMELQETKIEQKYQIDQIQSQQKNSEQLLQGLKQELNDRQQQVVELNMENEQLKMQNQNIQEQLEKLLDFYQNRSSMLKSQ